MIGSQHDMVSAGDQVFICAMILAIRGRQGQLLCVPALPVLLAESRAFLPSRSGHLP